MLGANKNTRIGILICYLACAAVAQTPTLPSSEQTGAVVSEFLGSADAPIVDIRIQRLQCQQGSWLVRISGTASNLGIHALAVVCSDGQVLSLIRNDT